MKGKMVMLMMTMMMMMMMMLMLLMMMILMMMMLMMMMMMMMMMLRTRTDPQIGTRTLCEAAQSKCTWTFHKGLYAYRKNSSLWTPFGEKMSKRNQLTRCFESLVDWDFTWFHIISKGALNCRRTSSLRKSRQIVGIVSRQSQSPKRYSSLSRFELRKAHWGEFKSRSFDIFGQPILLHSSLDAKMTQEK